MSRILCTGGSGFIGSHVVEGLVEDGHNVTVLDDASTGSVTNIKHVLSPEKCGLHVGTILDRELLQRLMRNCDVVVHLAAIRSVPRSLEDPVGVHDANATGTLAVLEVARKAGVKRVIAISSSSVLGPDGEGPTSPYGASKAAAEAYCRAYASSFGMDIVVLRPFNVFGPRQDHRPPYGGVIPIFITKILNGDALTIHGSGDQSKDFTPVWNVVHAIKLAITREEAGTGQALNIGCGRTWSVMQLARMLHEFIMPDQSMEVVFENPREGDVKFSQADLGLADHALDYEPVVSFKKGLKRTVEWYKSEEGREWMANLESV